MRIGFGFNCKIFHFQNNFYIGKCAFWYGKNVSCRVSDVYKIVERGFTYFGCVEISNSFENNRDVCDTSCQTLI